MTFFYRPCHNDHRSPGFADLDCLTAEEGDTCTYYHITASCRQTSTIAWFLRLNGATRAGQHHRQRGGSMHAVNGSRKVYATARERIASLCRYGTRSTSWSTLEACGARRSPHASSPGANPTEHMNSPFRCTALTLTSVITTVKAREQRTSPKKVHLSEAYLREIEDLLDTPFPSVLADPLPWLLLSYWVPLRVSVPPAIQSVSSSDD